MAIVHTTEVPEMNTKRRHPLKKGEESRKGATDEAKQTEGKQTERKEERRK